MLELKYYLLGIYLFSFLFTIYISKKENYIYKDYAMYEVSIIPIVNSIFTIFSLYIIIASFYASSTHFIKLKFNKNYIIEQKKLEIGMIDFLKIKRFN